MDNLVKRELYNVVRVRVRLNKVYVYTCIIVLYVSYVP